MKYILSAAVLAAATFNTAMAADVGVSVTINQPGFYGRIDIGGLPTPDVIFRDPVVVEHVPEDRPIVYLHVRPGHEKHWKKHCHEYNACGERVMFVKEGWYDREYAPRHEDEERDGYREDRRGEGRDGYREDNGRGDRGRGEGRGEGRGNRGDHGDRGDRGDRGDD